MERKYQSEILMVCHQDAEGMHRLGLIDDAKMREFDEGCLVAEQSTKTASRIISPVPVYAAERTN
jgi:DNA-binding transcriptional regulator YiaG